MMQTRDDTRSQVPPGQALQDDLFRRMSPTQRLSAALDWSRLVAELAAIGAADCASRGGKPISMLARLHGAQFASIAVAPMEGIDVLSVAQMQHCLTTLNRLQLHYCISGSLASSVWGRPRATMDADIVVALRAADAARLVAEFPGPEWYADLDAVRSAIADTGEFNVLHGSTGTKVDFWVLGNRPADRVRFGRRRKARLFDVECWILAPEDTILAKLEWTRHSPSERQESDILGIIAIQGDQLDLSYIDQWADRLDVTERWQRIRSSANDGIA